MYSISIAVRIIKTTIIVLRMTQQMNYMCLIILASSSF